MSDKVVDFGKIREKKLEEKRTSQERLLVKQMLGLWCVLENSKMRSIELLDISEEGCSFKASFDPENPWPSRNEDLKIRLYFSQEVYLPIIVRIVNSRPVVDTYGRAVRYGCQIDKSTSTYEAYCQFVRFLKTLAESAYHEAAAGGTSFFG